MTNTAILGFSGLLLNNTHLLAPRGLITVLLFLTAATTPGLETFPFGAIMLLVLSTAAPTALAQYGQGSAQVAVETAPAAAGAPVAQVAEERA